MEEKKNEPTALLFVYGTLKRHSPRSLYKYPGTAFINEATALGYTLYKMPFRKVPVMVPKHGHKVQGEVWQIPMSLLETLDKREGVKTGWYTRELILGMFQAYLWKHTTLFFKHIGERF